MPNLNQCIYNRVRVTVRVRVWVRVKVRVKGRVTVRVRAINKGTLGRTVTRKKWTFRVPDHELIDEIM